MAILPFRPEPYDDEALESYLLRLSQANDFDCFADLSAEIKGWLKANDSDAFGAFPLALAEINIYHAKFNSGFRTRALKLVEQITGLPPFSLVHLAIKHSLVYVAGKHAVAQYQRDLIPKSLLQTQHIPICPECLTLAPYIRQKWLLMPYQACSEHQTMLLHSCPECGLELNYTRCEQICYCECGYDLSSASSPKLLPINPTLWFSQWYDNLITPSAIGELDHSGILSFYLWFLAEIKPDDDSLAAFRDFTLNWPTSFKTELKRRAGLGLLTQTQQLNRTAFNAIFGDVIHHSANLPNAANPAFAALCHYLTELVYQHPLAKLPNIADTLLSVAEASLILGVSQDQVYRLHEEGYLKMNAGLKLHQKVPYHKPVFFLRQVVELMESGFCKSPLAAW